MNNKGKIIYGCIKKKFDTMIQVNRGNTSKLDQNPTINNNNK